MLQLEDTRYRHGIENLIVCAGILEAVIIEIGNFDPSRARSLKMLQDDLINFLDRLKRQTNYDEDI